MSVAASRVRTPVESPLRRFWSQFSESRIALAGLAMLVFVVAAALFAPWLAPQNPYDLASLDLLDSRLAPGERGMSGGSYLLGTDGQGRDMLSAIFFGLRTSFVPLEGSRFEDDGPLGADALHAALARLAAVFGEPVPLNLWVRTAPSGAESFCWRIDMFPRLTQPGGLELGTGLWCNTVAPERAAARLREAAVA